MEIDDTTNHSWADLPKELLEMISKRLDSLIDVYRFRVVCMSWRSLCCQYIGSSTEKLRRAWNDELQNLSADAEYPVRYLPICRAKTISIRVYKLDEELGTWVNIIKLLFWVRNECSFSVSAKEFSGGEGNCIYFIDPFDAGRRGQLSGCDARVCDLSSGRISKVADFPGHSCMLWPDRIQDIEAVEYIS